MKRIKLAFALLIISLSGSWWLAEQTVWSSPQRFFSWRAVLPQYSGVLAIGVMSVAMILAVRPVAFEPFLGGLDKMYRLHKWLGVSALILSISHWLLVHAPHLLTRAGRLERSARPPHPAPAPGATIEQFLLGQRGLAESIGTLAVIVALVLMVLALVKRFPYRHFFKTHRLLSVAYLALVWHAVVLLKFDYWRTVLGPSIAALMGAGSVAALMVLFRRVAVGRQAVGEVAALIPHESLKVLELVILLKGRWAGHDAGQFAFVTFHKDEGAHPFTITSPWTGDGRISFIIKALGDYTATLAERLHVGDLVRVEGPYGQFNFRGESGRQIWVGGGIGITPFIARMKSLALNPDGKAIDLFHTTAVYDAHAIELLEADARAAKVRLHVWWDQRDGLLNADRVCQGVPDWQDADVWFCGPAKFGRALRKDLTSRGLPEARFHQELFEMR